MNHNGHPRAVLYARFSPRPVKRDAKGERREETTNEVQLELMREACKREGLLIRAEVCASYSSGGLDPEDDPKLQEAIAALHRGDTLCVYRLDRLARNTLRQLLIFRDVEAKGCKVRSLAGEGTETEGLTGELVRDIMAAVNQHKRREAAARTSAYMRRYQTQGRRMSAALVRGISRTPYGSCVDPRDSAALAPNEKELAALAKMRLLRNSGLSYRQIAANLAALDYPPRGARWHARSIARILTKNSPGSCGEY